ncbi:MAG TPA: hypothetical protein VER03_25385, partial [Bryobacteraceae bacterium]|nr:hypothetical protein [Bryobacteraceae bacterium]
MNLATRAAFALVLAAGIARSETPAATDWNRVKAVHVGQSIRVLTEDKKHDGVFVRATDTAVELTSNRNDAVIIGRSEVTRISTKSKSHRGRNTAIGTAV